MPYVLQHKGTGEIFACRQVNHYNLAYFGVKYWEREDEVESNRVDFLQSQGISDPENWQPLELEENRVKTCNVKLKNDPANRIYMDNGMLIVQKNKE